MKIISQFSFSVKQIIRNLHRKILDQIAAPYAPSKYKKHLDITGKALDSNAANSFIYHLLSGEDPCMIARFGSVEVNAMLAIERLLKKPRANRVYTILKHGNLYPLAINTISCLKTNAGFFPIDKKNLEKYLMIMKDAVSELDLLASWVIPESRYTRYLTDLPACQLRDLEPYFHDNPWSRCLQGKRVLVIHPFASLIQTQYSENRIHLFSDRDVLPDFHLRTITAVQTIAGNRDIRFDDWFQVLEWMQNEALREDFDIAIIGCGAYGFPLAAHLKRYGKKCIHLGGATQLLFGIKGKRWEQRPDFQALFNDHWVCPGAKERPINHQSIEGGCYW